MTKPPKPPKPPKRMGRPPAPDRRRQVFAFIRPGLADWFMGLPPKERTVWLEQMIENDPAFKSNGSLDGSPTSTPPDDTAS